MTVRICRLYRAFEQHAWLCEGCITDFKRAGYEVELKAPVDFECDFCGHREVAKEPERKAKGAE